MQLFFIDLNASITEVKEKLEFVINGKLREITKDREAAACLYTLVNNCFGQTINAKNFNNLPKGDNF